MPNLGAIHEPVRFDFTAAAALSAELRGVASQLDDQVRLRRGQANAARAEWRGAYGDQFDRRVGTCTSDAIRFAAAMRRAADQLEELAARARAEEARRGLARQWEMRQASESLWNKAGDFLFGEDDLPPLPPPDPPARFVSEAPMGVARGSASSERGK